MHPSVGRRLVNPEPEPHHVLGRITLVVDQNKKQLQLDVGQRTGVAGGAFTLRAQPSQGSALCVMPHPFKTWQQRPKLVGVERGHRPQQARFSQ